MASYTAGKPDAPRELLEPGDYDCVVVAAEETVSSKGNDMIKLQAQALNAEGEEIQGALLYEYLVFSEKAFFKIDQFRLSCGEEITEGEEVDIQADDLIGCKCRVRVIVGDNGKGSDRNEIDCFLPPEEKEGF